MTKHSRNNLVIKELVQKLFPVTCSDWLVLELFDVRLQKRFKYVYIINDVHVSVHNKHNKYLSVLYITRLQHICNCLILTCQNINKLSYLFNRLLTDNSKDELVAEWRASYIILAQFYRQCARPDPYLPDTQLQNVKAMNAWNIYEKYTSKFQHSISDNDKSCFSEMTKCPPLQLMYLPIEWYNCGSVWQERWEMG